MTGRQHFNERRSTGLTRSIALGFKVTFEVIVTILLVLAGIALFHFFFSGSSTRYMSGEEIFILLLSLIAFLIGLVLLFGVIALQIRNNDLLMDIRDGQRELNETMREFVRLVRQG